MTTEQIVRRVADCLEELGISYMLVGSFSSNAYGIPRNTNDADFVVELGATPIDAVARRLGPEFRLNPQMSFETVTGTTRFIFDLPEEEFQVEVFMLTSDPHNQSRFARRQRRDALGGKTWLPSPEDVVVTKLRWSLQGRRPQDLIDVRNVLSVSGPDLDWAYMERWCDRHGTRKLLDDLRRSIPPM